MIVQGATAEDAEALAAIYGHHVLHGFGTFEEEPPSPPRWRPPDRHRRSRMPCVVAEEAGRVRGFAYAARAARPRQAYRYTLEDSVYIAPDAIGKGVGRAVLSALIAECEALGIRQLVAVIGDSGSAASIGLHRALGFVDAGVGKSFGFKHGRWVDIVWMQKSLNGGDQTQPDTPGVRLSGS